jgi:hypothetical protein
LHRLGQFLFIARMHSKVTLALGMALTTIAFCCFVESGLAQDALTAPVAASDNDEIDGDDTDKDEKSRRLRSHKSGGDVRTLNAPWVNASENHSLGVTSVAETADAEGIVVTGAFDIFRVAAS